jgi:hypothetical protein
MELGSFVGLYAAFKEVPGRPASGVWFDSIGRGVKQEKAVAFGLRLSIPISKLLGAEGSILYFESDLGGSFSSSNSNFWAATLRLTLRNSNEILRERFGINAGVVVVGNGGDVAAPRNRPSWGYVVGGTFMAPLCNKSSFRLDVEQYIYKRDWGSWGGFRFDDAILQDMVLSVGISAPLPL